MRERRLHPRNTRDRPIFREPSLLFLKYSVAFLLAGSAAVLVAIFRFEPAETMRSFGPGAVCLLALSAWILLARGRIESAVYLLGIGMWLIVTCAALFTGGLSSPAAFLYPQIILLIGWFLGVRAGIAAALAAIATTLGFALAESRGLLPVPFPTTPAIPWIIQSCVFALSVVLVVFFVRSYQGRLNEVNRMHGDLNRAQAVAQMGSWVYEIAPDVMRLSAEAGRIFGVPDGATSNYDAFLSRVHPEDREAVDRAWRAAAKDSEPFDSEHRILAGAGVRWVRQRAELERSPDGTPRRRVGIAQDITGRRRAEAAKRASEEQMQAFYELDLVGLAITSPDKGWVRVNHCLCQMLEYSEEELLGMTWAQLTHPDDLAADLRQFDRLLAHEIEGYSLEKRFVSRRGKIVPAQLVVRCTRKGNGELDNVIAMVEDISERRRMEEALRMHDSRYRTVVETSSDGFWVVDVEGRLRDVNDAYVRRSGYTRDELLGMHVYDLDAQETQADAAAHIRTIMSKGGDVFETLHRAKDGTLWPVEVSVNSRVDETEPMLCFLRDIAERKRLENVQLRAQKMEALGTLAGGIAHDFNNALATILGNVELARQDVGPGHAALESLEEIGKASRRAKTLVQQILTFGRRQPAERKVISLAPAVEEAVRLLRATLPAGVRLDIECAPDAPPVLADATQVEQVLLNLCTNAWHAVEGQERAGVIEIRLTEETHASLRFASLAVCDNGRGMDEATRSRIFEPFFTTKPVDKGTGLGLSVVHGIVQAHEAQIDVRSAPGQGTTIAIRFPAAQNPCVATSGSDRPLQDEADGKGPVLPAGDKHILYIDDEEAIVLLMTRLLERQGYRVSGYTDPREALAAARLKPDQYDLVVTDYNMPGMSGLDLANELKKLRLDLPVAIATGYITEELREGAGVAGISELIYKPNSVNDLCAAVARLAQAAGKTPMSS